MDEINKRKGEITSSRMSEAKRKSKTKSACTSNNEMDSIDMVLTDKKASS